jgi:hypothetical protein
VKDAGQDDAILRIGQKVKEIAEYGERITFSSFKDLQNGGKPLHEL